jgi:hypothetical protein
VLPGVRYLLAMLDLYPIADQCCCCSCCCWYCYYRFDYNNMLQGTSYLMAKLEPNRKDQWSRTIRDSMATWLRGQDNITYTEKVLPYCHTECTVLMKQRGLLPNYICASCFTCSIASLHEKTQQWLSQRLAQRSTDSVTVTRCLLNDLTRQRWFCAGHGLYRQLGQPALRCQPSLHGPAA